MMQLFCIPFAGGSASYYNNWKAALSPSDRMHLRLALEKTQEDLGKILHMKQEGISRLEKRSDMLISTLNKYITSMGGSLKLMAEFPNRAPVEIHGISEIKSH